MAETQNDPLLPGYSFNAHLVAGLTPIEAEGYLDFYVDRPLGMKGYILNLTVRGEGIIKNNDQQFVCRPGDMLLFPPGEIHHYGRHPEAKEWYHQWVYFRPRATGRSGSRGRLFLRTPVLSPGRGSSGSVPRTLAQIIEAGQAGGRYAELLAINLLEQVLLRRMEAINASLNPPLDNRVRDACQYISDHLPTASSISPASPSMCVSHRRGCHICSVSSWALAS